MSTAVTAIAACTALLGLHAPSTRVSYDQAHATCVQVYEAAVAGGDPHPLEAAAQAGIESRWNAGAADGRGSFGALQVAPRYFCPDGKGEGCDLIAAGIRARAAWSKAARARGGARGKHGDARADALCMYWLGYRYKGGGCSYTTEVLRLAKAARAAVKRGASQKAARS